MTIFKHCVSSVSTMCVLDVNVLICPEKPSLKNNFLGTWPQNGAFSTTKNQQIIRAYADIAVSYPPVVILPSPRRVQRLHHTSSLMVPPIAFF